MNDPQGTAAQLVASATQLFAQHGFQATSVRAIIQAANTNLGAITYHFGSKEALYEAVFASVVEPSRAHLATAAEQPGTPLERIERVVRAMFRYLYDHPELPRFIMQHLAGSRPLPDAGRRTLAHNVSLLAQLIALGQSHGSIRAGDPRLMALSIGSQPIYLTLVRRALQEGAAIDQDDPGTRAQLVDSVVRFVLAGLAAAPEQAS